ncbi:sel1 repeat family protein [Campylobacter sp. RM13119]|uniref:tetratricopeptide repeat protein n=1 Tax=Campylobacter TaxID=194 RepID=UPI001475EC72|nr:MULTISPECIES: sel1 repeat family protein [unclassified Campylobacter]MBE3021918.1 sel1 repeat family protein [Campylobacter sp. 7477a]MBE3605983.1 sel1 repeat family protein [Campylobacter sp. RM13119]MBE3609654.1 sel1 repeat family protein [Campylobacter sp. RM12916]
MYKFFAGILFVMILLVGCAKPDTAQKHFENFEAAMKVKDYDKAKKNVDSACAMNHAQACYADGQLYLHAQNKPSAIKRFTKACEFDHALACAKLGRLLMGSSDIKGGFEALKKACELQDALSCAYLARLHTVGMGEVIKKDESIASEYHKKACMIDKEFCEQNK